MTNNLGWIYLKSQIYSTVQSYNRMHIGCVYQRVSCSHAQAPTQQSAPLSCYRLYHETCRGRV